MFFDASPRHSARRIEGLRFRGPLAPRLDPPTETDAMEELKVCHKKRFFCNWLVLSESLMGGIIRFMMIMRCPCFLLRLFFLELSRCEKAYILHYVKSY